LQSKAVGAAVVLLKMTKAPKLLQAVTPVLVTGVHADSFSGNVYSCRTPIGLDPRHKGEDDAMG
jgi:hypothetical protein